MTRFFDALAGLQVRRPFVPIAIAFLLSVVGGLLATRLELRTRFDQLLPDHQRSVIELRRVMAETDANTNVFVVLEDPSGSAPAEATAAPSRLRVLGDRLVPRLAAIGRPWVASAADGVQEPRAFLSPRAGLFLSLPELVRLRDDVTRRWDWEVAKRMNSLIDDDAPEPEKITGEVLRKRFKGDHPDEEDDDERFPDGYYQDKEGKTLIVVAHTEVPGGELGRAEEALARITKVVDEVRAAPEFHGLKVGYAGDLVTGLSEYGAVKDDLVSTGALGVGLVLAVVLLFFMRLRALLALGLTIATGLSWTFGLTQLAIGHLNVATGFLFSIVAGNGINFGIIYLARYFEERRKSQPVAEAVRLAHQSTWPATMVAAFSAAASYGSLGVTDFRAFKHFAFIGGVGMIVCWIATYLLLPAVLVVVDRVRPFRAEGHNWFQKIRVRGIRYDLPFAWAVPRAPRLIACAGVALAIVGVGVGVRYMRSDPMEYNMRKLQNDLGESAEMYRLSKVAADILGAKLESAMVVLLDRPDQAGPLRKLLNARKDEAPEGEKPFEKVHTILDFLPDGQVAKIPVLEEIRERTLRARELQQITDQDWPDVSRVMPPPDLIPYGVNDLPEELARPFADKEGVRGRVVLIEPTKGKNDSDLRYLLRWADSFRETRMDDGEVIYGSGRAVIFADMLSAVVRDMPPAIALSLGMTVLAVLVTFRRGRSSAAVLFALAVGLFWLVAYVAFADVKINFFNFIAFPITFGIGVDYAVNFVQRYDEGDRDGILGVLRNTGGAVILCSLTTMLGYLALLGSINQAIRSLGAVAVMGEVCCLLAAVLVLPAAFLWRERKALRPATLAWARSAEDLQEGGEARRRERGAESRDLQRLGKNS